MISFKLAENQFSSWENHHLITFVNSGVNIQSEIQTKMKNEQFRAANMKKLQL